MAEPQPPRRGNEGGDGRSGPGDWGRCRAVLDPNTCGGGCGLRRGGGGGAQKSLDLGAVVKSPFIAEHFEYTQVRVRVCGGWRGGEGQGCSWSGGDLRGGPRGA